MQAKRIETTNRAALVLPPVQNDRIKFSSGSVKAHTSSLQTSFMLSEVAEAKNRTLKSCFDLL
jgi:hypothetical protein